MCDQKVYLVSGVRTPIASFRGSFKDTSAVELGAIAAKEALTRSSISPADVEETFCGTVLTANTGQNPGRQVAIKAGCPMDTQAVTINKVCSSSLKALTMAAISIKAGYRKRTLVVGCENMSQVPFYVSRGEIPYGGMKMIDGVAKDGLEDAILSQPMGFCAEKSAKDFNVSRVEQDAYAIESYKKAAAAWQAGKYSEEVMSVSLKQRRGPDVVVSEDEEFKKLLESKVPGLSPVFVKDGTGTITAANASSLNDGAVAAVVVAADALPSGVVPLAEVVAWAEAGLDPVDFTVAPIPAVKKLLAAAGLTVTDVDLWEVNEAFSLTALAFIRELGLDRLRVNVKGGAVALGHPLGMSGLRIVVSLAHSLQPGQLGVATICNGGGEAMAMLIRK